MPPSLLDHTRNLLILYRHHVGKSEVPAEFHTYCGLALLAACVADRVWVEKKRGFKLYPNLYTFLLGPSAIGKGDAIDEAVKFINPPAPASERVHFYGGDATAPALLRHMSRTFKPVGGNGGTPEQPFSKLFFVTPELSMSLGKGEKADSLIKLMTEMYSGRPYPLSKATVTRGEATLTGYNLNWLAGTTVEWLHSCVPPEAIKGGFWGRTLAVTADYNLDVRYRRPEYPPDRDGVLSYLYDQFYALSTVEGEMHLTEQAEHVEELWYQWRPKPTDDDLIPNWKRAHDMLLKLAMLFSLAEGPSLWVTEVHLNLAMGIIRTTAKCLPELIESASVTMETAGIDLVTRLMRGWGRVSRQHLLATVHRRITETKLDEIVRTLVGAGKMKRVAGITGPAYVWAERRRVRLPPSESPEPVPLDPAPPEP